MTSKRIRIIAAVAIILFASGIIIAALIYNGIIWFNNPSKSEYPVRGVDVSSYQGDIDWQVLSSQGIDFAFIIATEGTYA